MNISGGLNISRRDVREVTSLETGHKVSPDKIRGWGRLPILSGSVRGQCEQEPAPAEHVELSGRLHPAGGHWLQTTANHCPCSVTVATSIVPAATCWSTSRLQTRPSSSRTCAVHLQYLSNLSRSEFWSLISAFKSYETMFSTLPCKLYDTPHLPLIHWNKENTNFQYSIFILMEII